ncbi:hypothetical protein FTUN_6705 [Frigoriglobus tundricola]|uniref:Uncharacterized protein n=1 Tax=Frigoriglobus tundricola TaxID=2774151 RepID=A0A6M5YYB4_9BACT|nr:hypothetical protein FTUN_6705 [Frigoriglobus tundricola]
MGTGAAPVDCSHVPKSVSSGADAGAAPVMPGEPIGPAQPERHEPNVPDARQKLAGLYREPGRG